MPNCFSLTRKTALEDGPVDLSKIDEEMCAFFNQPCNPVKWHCDWFNTIGLDLAMGKDFAQQALQTARLLTTAGKNEDADAVKWYVKQLCVIAWLDENFVEDAWAEVGRK